MTDEPEWPTAREIADWFYQEDWGNVETLNGYVTAKEAIGRCRAAWKAVNDDPADSDIGEVRRHPDYGNPVVLLDHADRQCWAEIIPGSQRRFYQHPDVKGWPVIGAVPGSSADKAGR